VVLGSERARFDETVRRLFFRQRGDALGAAERAGARDGPPVAGDDGQDHRGPIIAGHRAPRIVVGLGRSG
jgi:hypothetical protein